MYDRHMVNQKFTVAYIIRSKIKIARKAGELSIAFNVKKPLHCK
ncbi:hypothetical protein PLUTE_a0766 [Pseudoalteromonas luteoviolacea DSM 6061]|nr:hypothetical protein [Pseudoalteromonas luteoviolacea DSM 6061]